MTELINAPISTTFVLNNLAMERARQDKKNGDQSQKSLDRLMNIITEEVGEAATEVNDIAENKPKADWYKLREELVQAGACCVLMIEAIDVKMRHGEHNYDRAAAWAKLSQYPRTIDEVIPEQ